MSLRIIKAGVLDTIQDGGRWGYQALGINPTGAMDRFSAGLANALLGKRPEDPVIELYFPAARVLFEQPSIICICGADFTPAVNDRPVPMDHPLVVRKGAVLQFREWRSGSVAYLSVFHPLRTGKWLGSYSTNGKAGAGGLGRPLRNEDRIAFGEGPDIGPLTGKNEVTVLPWKALDRVDPGNELECLIGSEWHWLSPEARSAFQNNWFEVMAASDRMGYRLKGYPLAMEGEETLISSAVSFGTIQLLPNGQLIVLMADHQTTGGYPRVAHVISAHLPLLAQKKSGNSIRFKMTSLEQAEEKMVGQKKYLQQLQIACKFKMENLLHASL